MSRAKRDVQHADVTSFTILERVDPKTIAVEELPTLTAVPRLTSPRWYLGYVLTATETNAVCGHDRRTRLGTATASAVSHPPRPKPTTIPNT